MKNIKILFIIIVVILLIIYYNYFEIISVLNSHYGDNLSTSESDNKNKSSKNIISRLYNNQVEKYYNNSPFKTNIRATEIPKIHVSQLTKDKFIELSKNFTHPFVVKGFLKDCPAVKKWNLDFFKDKYGKTKLPIIQNADIKTHKDYLDSSIDYDYKFITVSEFVDKIKKGEKAYLNNVSRIFGYHPELLNDMDLGKVKDYSGVDLKDEIHVTNMFIGGKGTGTSLHSSITGNFFYNIKGNKKWYLINPDYSKYLKPRLSRTGLFAVSLFDICNAKPGDYILNIPRYEVTLDEGDLLFNPPWWWHAVTNESKYTIGCANRFTSFWSGYKNNLLFTTIFFSHPIANYSDFSGGAKSTADANIEFDKALLADILKKDKKLE